MSKQNLLNDFLSVHTVNDVRNHVSGELNEFATENASYFFGNGELLISPANENERERLYVVDVIGFEPVLVEV